MANKIIEVEQLQHQFGAVRALDGLTYSVEEGEVFGVLGPNGAGKTTSIRILNGILTPSSGKVRVLDMNPTTQGCEIRQHTGVLTETPSLYERLTARDNLQTFGALYNIPERKLPGQVSHVLEQFGLTERADDLAGSFSKGMKQRLALARAFLHDPQLLFLDEPTAALDPEAAHQVTQLIEQLSHQEGRTVFLCTHNLDEAQRLCDRVAVLNKGRLLALGTLEQLSQTLWKGAWVVIDCDTEVTPAQLAGVEALVFVRKVEPEKATLAIQVENIHQVPDLVSVLVNLGARITQVVPRKHSLEDIYFALQEVDR
jgi:ABC-2 type transport system ATP-binding protein